MYKGSYGEVLEDAPHYARANERAAILHSIRLLELAEKAGANSKESAEALYFLRRLWEAFVEQLAAPDNALPVKLRADLISVGIGLLRTAEAIRLGESSDFESLREISQSIADGLQ